MPEFNVQMDLLYKAKPWRKGRQLTTVTKAERGRRLHRITRLLVVHAAPKILNPTHYEEEERKRRAKNRRPENIFLPRNLIASVPAFDGYQSRLARWMADHPPAFASPDKVVHIDDSNVVPMDDTSLESVEFAEDLSFSSANNDSSAVLLDDKENTPVRAFHTVWHVGKLGTKAIKTRNDATEALNRLAHSAAVNKSMQKPCKGPDVLFDTDGRPVAVDDNQRKSLTPKVQLCLSRWSRLMHYTADWTPGDESGEEEDAVDTWNNMARNASLAQPKTPTSNSVSVGARRPSTASKAKAVRRSPRLPPLNATR